jgi:uncharacterized protein
MHQILGCLFEYHTFLHHSQTYFPLVYGSYARGDYNENSDVDVMILVNTPLEKINSYYDQVSDCAFDFMMKYGVDISPVIKNVEHFNYWKDDLPYYHNVLKEGVAV